MTKTIKLALVAAMAMGATSAFATNGDNLIGLGAKSRAMGGTGIAHFNGAETATSNPALITKSKGTNFAFGGTYFSPAVEIETNTNGVAAATGAGATYESDAKHNVIPYVALTENLGNGFAVGVSMFGSAGMGVDYRSTGGGTANGAEVFGMRSNLLLLKFSIPVAYGQDNWSVGIAPVLMYGSLDMSLNFPTANPPAMTFKDVGNGSSSSFGTGLELGAAYTLPDLGLTIGATYHSAIKMEYKDQISSISQEFSYPVGQFSDKLDQPAEYGLGIDWTEGDLSLTMDWKNIRWENARGYQDFGWRNQDVYALGAEYRMDDLSLRAGFNYAENPIEETPASDGGRLNLLNMGMFPAVTQRHYTIGAGYQFTKHVAVDLAATYGVSGDITSDTGANAGIVKVTNDQMAFSANLNYSF
ncbi:MAG: aromatic hydrocarbon degradation protein [Arcobacter sp.]|nr:MAG: aromatic hydrocarbon degradation protein [Arcobacter sp.]